MSTIELSGKFPSLREILKRAGKENVILKTPDGREFVLAEIDNFDREIELTRQNEELMKIFGRTGERSKNFYYGRS